MDTEKCRTIATNYPLSTQIIQILIPSRELTFF